MAEIVDDMTTNHTLLYSHDTLLELAEVLVRPKFAKYIDREDSKAFVQAFVQTGQKIEVKSIFAACRDPRDDKFLALAVDGQADCIVSGDKDLLDMKSFQNIPIIPLADFPNLQ